MADFCTKRPQSPVIQHQMRIQNGSNADAAAAIDSPSASKAAGVHSFGKSIAQPIRFVDLLLALIRHLLQLGSFRVIEPRGLEKSRLSEDATQGSELGEESQRRVFVNSDSQSQGEVVNGNGNLPHKLAHLR